MQGLFGSHNQQYTFSLWSYPFCNHDGCLLSTNLCCMVIWIYNELLIQVPWNEFIIQNYRFWLFQNLKEPMVFMKEQVVNWWFYGWLFEKKNQFFENHGYILESGLWFLKTTIMNLKNHSDNQCWAGPVLTKTFCSQTGSHIENQLVSHLVIIDLRTGSSTILTQVRIRLLKTNYFYNIIIFENLVSSMREPNSNF
jgi:hypothetical protein